MSVLVVTLCLRLLIFTTPLFSGHLFCEPFRQNIFVCPSDEWTPNIKGHFRLDAELSVKLKKEPQ